MTNIKRLSISESRIIPLEQLEPNSGQVEGIPANPRYLTDKEYKSLKKSIKENPELLTYRELLIYPYEDRYVIIGGNSRYRALYDLGYTEAPCKIISAGTAKEVIKKYILLDNKSSGEWELSLLADGWSQLEIDDIGLNIELPDISTDEIPVEDSSDETDEKEDDNVEDEEDNMSFYQSMLSDCLYESNNIYDIPTLRLDMQAGKVILPLAPWGADSRLRKDISTYHFYVEDYRFEAIWKDPTKILISGVRALVEPNLSLFDTTPVAYGLQQIYKKRWISRYFQECGIKVYADLNVSRKFQEYNKLGIPKGYNAFFTRGYADRISHLEEELEIAREISGLETPNLIIYGGGAKVHEFCAEHNLVYVEQYMQAKKNG